MSSKLMDKAEIQQWILRKMGAPLVRVELTQDMLDDAIDEATHWFSAKKGLRAQYKLYLNSGQVEYPLEDFVDTVYDVSFTPTNGATDFDRIIDPLSLIDGIPEGMFTGGSFGGVVSSYAQTVQYLEMAKRILGTELEWVQQGKNLLIFPPETSGAVIIDYKANKFTIEQLNERDHDLVKRYAHAEAKEILGRVRGKFDTFPGAQGGTSFQGGELLQESSADKEKLDEEIALSGYPVGFLTG